jgi:hypothetical protein
MKNSIVLPSKFFQVLFLVLFCTFGFIPQVHSQNKVNESTLDLYKNLKTNLALGLKYMDTTQLLKTTPNHSFRGEWQTTMGLERGFFLLGRRKKVDDSNCFSIAATHNSLAKIYLAFPEYKNIPHMLDLSFEKIMTYRNGAQFNFWNLLPPNRKLKKGAIIGKQPLVRRPTNYNLKTKYINNAANIIEDSDDTGLGYTALALRKKIYKRDNKIDSLYFEINAIAPIFDQYRDINRNNRHWYNYIYGNDHETGAYLTWLGEEYQFKHWNIIKVIGHNATSFLPFSECFPHAYKPYIPYGSNDLDGVVNANILSTLSLYGELNSKGADCAIKYIEKKSKAKKYDNVGIYYPNRYQFPYAVSEAYANGVDKLENSSTYIIEYLIETQNEDGSWYSRHVINKKDTLQSTAYALNALINFGDLEQKETLIPIEKAIQFILKQSIQDENGIHWKGGVFFSGGTVVRKNLFWKSDAYTTAIILKAFANYRKYLELNYNIPIQ